MFDPTPTPRFEDEIRAALATPPARLEFVARLHTQMMQRALSQTGGAKRPFFLRPAWVVCLATLGVILTVTLLIGPQRVVAAMRSLLGYIPGVGIVDQSAPLRVLAAPVSVTRQGVTVSVNRATLTAEKTLLDFGVAGVPLSAYPKEEQVSGCIEPEYLRLPDGTKQDLNAPIPARVNEATFVLPCIFNTLPGAVPTDWELPLRFVPAPPDLTVLPVIALTPAFTATATLPPPTTQAAATGTPLAPTATSDTTVTIAQVIETDAGYILIGVFHPHTSDGAWAQVTGIPQIRDANGMKVDYTIPQDIQPSSAEDMPNGGFPFAFQFKAASLAFPLTIEFSGVLISHIDPQAAAEVTFDAGPNPQPGQNWHLNQDVQLASHTVRLVSITAQSDGYSFYIDPGAGLSGVSVQIAGYQPTGGGGGGAWGGAYYTSMVYSELPKGKLKIILSDPLAVSNTQTWQGRWQPDAPRTAWPALTQAPSLVCVSAESFNQLQPLPSGLDGRALLTELNPELNLVLANLDGSQKQVLAPQGSRGSLSPDGRRLAYAGSDGITILDLATGNTTRPKSGGYDLHWSPDGMQIAFVNPGDAYGVFVINVDGANQRQLSNLGYESIAGWSLNGKQIYYAIPDSSGQGWRLKAVDVASAETHDLFILENSSRKAPMPVLSPDGNWIAYRGLDNGSLYLIRLDGTQGHLVIEKPSPASAISGIAWGPGGGLLGVSMITPEAQDGAVILMQPDGCETYVLPSLHGELDGLLIP